jgi:hypothetical protein
LKASGSRDTALVKLIHCFLLEVFNVNNEFFLQTHGLPTSLPQPKVSGRSVSRDPIPEPDSSTEAGFKFLVFKVALYLG